MSLSQHPFAADTEWLSIVGDGYTLRVDPERQSPLSFAISVAAGLDSRPRRLDASYLYDAKGSELFEQITAQPEYYLTRVEDALLREHAGTIRERVGASILVELGSGASTKTQRLLDAWTAAGPSSYVPVDVDAVAIEHACQTLRKSYPESRLSIHGLAASYERALATPRGDSPITLVFLGSSLGNLGFREYPAFCESVTNALTAGDHFLVGVDLVKDPSVLEAAYNDDAGITAAFTRNLFTRMNRELGTRISESDVAHVAYYDRARERIEIFAEARRELTIVVPSLEREFRIAPGERIQTEVSHKFRPDAFIATVEGSGLELRWSTDASHGFGLYLFRKPPLRARSSVPGGRARAAEDWARLSEMRARTLQITAPLREADLQRQHSRLMSPLAWDLGHIADFEAQWLLAPDPAPAPKGEPLYDALATPRADRSRLPLPPVAEVWQELRRVRARVEDELLGTEPSPFRAAGTFAVPLVLQHEAQHQETMLQAIALREDLEYRPGFVQPNAASVGARAATDRVLVPGGRFRMGTDDRHWAYDNERPAHDVEVSAFYIGRAPVTNREFHAFIADGGYRRSELWSERGWAWVQRAECQAPAHWRRVANGAADVGGDTLREYRALVFGRLEPLHPDSVVMHVSWYEADAFARWAGGRLPTEAEWEKAAAWDPSKESSRLYPWGDEAWDPSRANLDQRHLEPGPGTRFSAGQSAYGCLQLLGDVWEWTSSWFAGYPGFVSFPYDEYSKVFFGEQYRVLRGGSFATRAIACRNTFRNWDLPERRQIFAGFRCLWPAE